MPSLVNFAQLRAFDSNGDPVPGAKAYFYAPGTTTPATVYSDSALSTAHPVPLEADAAGVFAPVYSNNAVKVDVTTSAGAAVPGYPLDPAYVGAGVDGSGDIQLGTFSSTGATAGTLLDAGRTDTSASATSATSHLRAYNPNGQIIGILSSGSDAIIRAAAGSLILQAGGSTTRATLSSTTLTLASGVSFAGNGSGITDLASAAVGTAVAGIGSGGVGTTILARYGGATSPIAIGTTVSGSDLAPASADGTSGGTTPSGTWMCAGRATTASDVARTTLWRRTV